VKEFLSPQTVRDNGILLASRIRETGFVPDVVYLALRGGAHLGCVIVECARLWGDSPRIAAFVARSYHGQERGELHVDGWTLPPEKLQEELPQNAKIMVVDDIFDSGRSMNFVCRILLAHGVLRENLKVVVHDFRETEENLGLDIQPDFFVRKFSDDRWIHYLEHELEGLTEAELREYYPEGVRRSIGVPKKS
jgi:hypoxanthine phosphoribosyltransferase